MVKETYYEVPQKTMGNDLLNYFLGVAPRTLGDRKSRMVKKCFELPEDNGCLYKRDVSTVHTKTLETTKIDRKRIIPLPDHGAKKCVISMRGMIDGEWHHGNASFVFDSSMSEDEACDRAIGRAKEKIYRNASPEVFSSKVEMDCKVKVKQ